MLLTENIQEHQRFHLEYLKPSFSIFRRNVPFLTLLLLIGLAVQFPTNLKGQTPHYDAEIIEQYAPAQLAVSDTSKVWVTARNIGSATWHHDGPDRVLLAVPNDGQGHPWGFGRVVLPHNVSPGQTVTFFFEINRSQTGQVPFQWQLLWEGHYRFGAPSPLDQVDVINTHFGGNNLHHIDIREQISGEQELYHRETGQSFVPRGANIVRDGATDHEMFDVGLYNADREAMALYRLRKKGFNSIRVWVSPNGLSELENGTTPKIDPLFAQNVKDFLKRCREQKIYAQITFSYFLGEDYNRLAQRNEDMNPRNAFYLDSSYIDVRSQIFRDFIQELLWQNAPTGQVLCWNLVNEFKFREDSLPFSRTTGYITTVTGTYDLGSPAGRDSLMYQAARYCANEWTSEVKSVDSSALCAIGWYSPLAVSAPHNPNNPWITIPGVTALHNTDIDIIDLHTYPNQTPERDLDVALASMGYSGQVDKVTILGEFGFLRDEIDEGTVIDSALYYITRSCQLGIDGWMYWTWDPYDINRFWTMIDNDDMIGNAIAPINRPTPCLSSGGISPYQQATTDVASTNLMSTEKGSTAFLVFPNPAHESLHLQWKTGDEPASASLYNAQGILVSTKTQLAGRSQISFNLQSLKSGFYLLQVQPAEAGVKPHIYKVFHP